jgi:shikimate dehydrogenase
MAELSRRAFVIGWPISHSLSPQLHGYWLKQHGIEGSYEKIALPPEDLDEFLQNIGKNKFVGGNVTIPHKQKTFAKIANPNATAKRLEAVNTLWFENGLLKAGNTDCYGFSANLDDFAPRWRKAKTALVLGAGGASSAVLLALVNAGIEKIFIINRTRSRAESLAKKMAAKEMRPNKAQCQFICADMDDLPNFLRQSDILINTTSLGMEGQPPLEIDISALPGSAIVSDIVYNPLETPLLIRAKAANLSVVDGIGMLLHQAVPGFEKWFGVRPEVTADMRQHILKILNGDH